MSSDLTADLKKYGLSFLGVLPLPISLLQIESLYWLAYVGLLGGLLYQLQSVVGVVFNYRTKFTEFRHRIGEATGQNISTPKAILMAFAQVPMRIGYIFLLLFVPLLIIDNAGLATIIISVVIGLIGVGIGLAFSGLVGASSALAEVRESEPRNE